ncbi:MAG: 2-oxoacid:acceptor oxidoreductase family protein [Firmicutes bacterium]|nr:2-oxoacid:acceptor oxidoreductase family protein [Bacillota bacterium]
MKYPLRISLCGFGGQGIVLSAVLLGTTAVTKEDLFAVQTQSYGSEARGGQCQAELIIDKDPINSPIADKKDILICLFQDAYNKYISTLEDDGVLVIDPDLVTNQTRKIEKTFAIPATQIAVDLGSRQAANMVVLGFVSECFGIIGKDNLIEAMTESVNPKFVESNTRAIQAGIDFAKEHGMYCRD